MFKQNGESPAGKQEYVSILLQSPNHPAVPLYLKAEWPEPPSLWSGKTKESSLAAGVEAIPWSHLGPSKASCAWSQLVMSAQVSNEGTSLQEDVENWGVRAGRWTLPRTGHQM